MSDLKSLRKRIKSVKSTQKITKAMKVVSAAKLRKVRMRAEASAPYAKLMRRVTEQLASGVDGDVPVLMAGNGVTDKRLLVVVSSDRGLCGSFNSHVMRKLREEIALAEKEGKKVSLMFLGRKAYNFYAKHTNYAIVRKEAGVSSGKELAYSYVEELAADLIARFEAGEFGDCRIVSTSFVNALVQKPVVTPLLPVSPSHENDAQDASSANATYEYEPSKEEILAAILPKNVTVQLYYAALESAASEHAARMTAMDNASRNASQMVSKLSLKYNRGRQAAITTELIEVISGAEAV